ncbi:shikimate dehydrogenase [Amphibacillus marinus]|uniref:Shikimate dehydrogenase (NADP(+)) n=1 Tax=Amphibacillus marinus TaxID=872970 RepID=A0A1H8NTM5_9BACI|nr:shikimate dehydrogenase [Amphibacillus marinus]SEO32986.1 shikimate dehydrogenase [Amphibacillus marinus]
MKLGLIGHPIQHSLSPWIHEQFIKQVGGTGGYQLFEMNPATFDQEIRQFKSCQIDGFNVTIPFKERIIPFLDFIEGDAATIGAVNTVVAKNGKWYGYNTDGQGFVQALKKSYPQFFHAGAAVLLLGAGGACRGIYAALAKEGFKKITIANRTIQRAEELASITNHTENVSVVSYLEAERTLQDYTIIINTTSVGMQPDVSNQAISLTNLQDCALVCDIVYRPFWTSFLHQAKSRGASVHHGHEMLLYQGKIAFELWSGVTIDADLILPLFERKIQVDV